MRIEELWLANVRNLINVRLDLGPGINVFYGPNGAGKTALFEAIYLLARGRSFRTHRIADLVRHGAEALQVGARLLRGDVDRVTTGVERVGGRLTFRFQGEVVRALSAQARQVPLIYIGPDVTEILSGAPRTRRHWLDWAMFHVEPGYLDVWQDYHRVLKQRNTLLRSSAKASELGGWELAMGRLAQTLDAARLRFLEGVQMQFEESGLWDGPALRIRLQSGWPVDRPLEEALAAGRNLDLGYGYTRYGPHRADVEFRLRDRDASRYLSRGESRRLMNLVRMAEARWLALRTAQPALLLFDDFGAELDSRARAELWNVLNGSTGQVFLNTPVADAKTLFERADFLFHVEHGTFTKMVK